MDRKKAAPSWGGVPKGITIYLTPDGWRHSIIPENGGFLCGRLPDLPPDASDDDAKSTAGPMLESLARESHGTDLEVAWSARGSPHTWNGEARRITAGGG